MLPLPCAVRLLDASTGTLGSFYCLGICRCHGEPEDLKVGMITGCKEGCENCDKDCRQVRAKLYGAPGYADGINSDGCYPVTEELKILLQMFAINQAVFVDGNGVVETDEHNPMDSDEESQWLFCCGYYDGDQGGPCQMGEKVPNYYG